jgi:hypothetical protein
MLEVSQTLKKVEVQNAKIRIFQRGKMGQEQEAPEPKLQNARQAPIPFPPALLRRHIVLLRNIRRAHSRITIHPGSLHPIQSCHAHWKRRKFKKTEALHIPKKLGEEPIQAGTQVNMKNNA